MRKRIVPVIIVLLSVSLVGIIALQALLIHDTWKAKEEMFLRDVANAMNASASRLERTEAATFISRQFSFTNNDGHIEMIGREESNGNPALISKEIRVISTNADGKEEVKKQVELEQVLVKSTDDSVSKIIKIKSDQFGEVVQQMALEWSCKDLALESRINMDELCGIIQSELKSRNISMPFEFAVMNGGQEGICCLKSGGYKDQFIPASLTTSLFPNEISGATDQLLLHFSSIGTYVFRSMWWMILLSVFFTLVIIATFGGAIYVMLKQKKMSDIKTDFINNMTHEFKTPIATISLALDAIHNPKVIEDRDRIRHYTGIISTENKRMNSQVENILQMSLLDKEHYELNQQLLDVHSLIERVADPIRMQVEKRNGHLILQLNAENPSVTADELHITNVIYNLLDNANKYSPLNPSVSIGTANVPNGILIYVEDNGIGMSSETQRHIFEKFYRAGSGNMHNVKGFGLGLAYVKSIINKHGGKISVKSELGKWSRFEIFLPTIHN